MAKGRGPSMPGNMGNMMKQMQKMQRDMEKIQAELDAREFETTVGGGAVKVRVNGKKEVVSIHLEESVVDPEDIEMLQDLIIAAVNQAVKIADEAVAKEMSKLTGGMNIPGLG
ncbi:MAG: bacteriocin leader domain-containing protein [delta proteobacterium ML8_F1]|nr:MAG: bacteriocin leader domain-containing protein [delta proteobacterium ML8_F1]